MALVRLRWSLLVVLCVHLVGACTEEDDASHDETQVSPPRANVSPPSGDAVDPLQRLAIRPVNRNSELPPPADDAFSHPGESQTCTNFRRIVQEFDRAGTVTLVKDDGRREVKTGELARETAESMRAMLPTVCAH